MAGLKKSIDLHLKQLEQSQLCKVPDPEWSGILRLKDRENSKDGNKKKLEQS